ncbi:MAG: twin-arginine translocase TatA/TatE family subunit [Proteobacteria bacterium]|nr:twin-arginine translocase TatA/TatE family subunit [Pseudomonadota bacterium]MBI3499661.1 twin-arginine translocase TatA/TatE family subunit [Pseudomonadota bacterium]
MAPQSDGRKVFMMGPLPFLLILLVIILLFYSNKLPDLMRDLGRGVAKFKRERGEKDRPNDPGKTD